MFYLNKWDLNTILSFFSIAFFVVLSEQVGFKLELHDVVFSCVVVVLSEQVGFKP